MKKLIILISFLFCLPAFASNDEAQDYQAFSDGYDYSCSLRSVIVRSKNFRYHQDAVDWCKPFGEFCIARRADYRGWQSYFERKYDFDYKSDQSWEHARLGLFTGYSQYIDEFRYFHEDFKHSFYFDGC